MAVDWLTKCVVMCTVVGTGCMVTGVLGLTSSVILFCLVAYGSHRFTTVVVRRRKLVNLNDLVDSVTTTWQRLIEHSTSSLDDHQDVVAAAVVVVPGPEQEPDANATGSVVTTELDMYVQLIMRDFVISWYQTFSDNEQFLKEVNYAVEDLTVALVSRARNLGLQKLLRKLVAIYHKFFLCYVQAKSQWSSSSVKNSGGGGGGELESCFTDWHFALDDDATERMHLRNLVDVTFEVLLPADVLCCRLLRRLLATVVAENVFLPLVDLVSDPGWVNSMLVTLLTDGGGQDLSARPQSRGKKLSNVNGSLPVAASVLPKSEDAELEGGEDSSVWKRIVDDVPQQQQQRRNLRRIPLSASLDKISDIFSSTIGELEKPIEYITGNLAHYFRLSGTEEEEDQLAEEHRDEAVEELSGDDDDGDHNVCSVLEKLLPVTTVPVLSEHLWGGHGRTDEEDEEDGQVKSEDSLEFAASGKGLQESPDECASTFTNLSIPSFEVVEENASGSSSYVVYCIQYDAWFHDTSEPEPQLEEEPARWILQTSVVRRRFREFEALHACLENDPHFRPLLRRIRGPNKWAVLPFSKLDKEAIQERRLDLEKYIQTLVSRDELARSKQLREFLAYGSDASIAYVRKLSDGGLPVPRIDKIFMKTMTGMLDKIKTALPSIPHDTNGSVVGAEPSHVGSPQQQKTSDILLGLLNINSSTTDYSSQIHVAFDYGGAATCDGTKPVEDLVQSFLLGYDVNYDKVERAYDAADCDQSFWNASPVLPEAPNFRCSTPEQRRQDAGVEPEVDEEDWASIDDDIPIASAVLNLSVDTITERHLFVDREPFVRLVKVVFGQILERWLGRLVDEFTTEAMFATYLSTIRAAIWPGGDCAPGSFQEEEQEQQQQANNDDQDRQLYELALRALKDYFPGFIELLLGPDQYERGMELFLDSLQRPRLLRSLVYRFLDVIADAVLIRSRSQSIMEKLGSSYCLT